jgi:BirA family transcriptional regulator, biotin operon repressor / biotin---[acetyl-CoA-carboxylase] ligase
VIASPGDLARAGDLARSRGLRLGTPLHVAAETVSTNDDAKAGARAGAPHGATWVAEAQRAGRGRQGRAWFGAAGESLLFSVLLRVPCTPARVPALALACGLAVRDAVAAALGEEVDAEASVVTVKWPNDVLVFGKKVAGVLVESAVAGSRVEHVVVGCGINVYTREWPEELRPLATSLALARDAMTGAPPARPELDRAAILVDVLAGLDRDAERVLHRGIEHLHARLTRHDALAGREVEGDAIGRGVARGIDAEGRLRVELPDGTTRAVVAGEVRAVISHA